MHRPVLRTLLAAAGLSLALPALAAPNALGLDSGLNLLVFGDFSARWSDVQGRVAAGGNVALDGYSINEFRLAGPALTVGGNFSFGGGTVHGTTLIDGDLATGGGSTFDGAVAVGGNLNANGQWIGYTSLSVAGSTLNVQPWQSPAIQTAAAGSKPAAASFAFAAEQTRLTQLSTQLDGLANRGTVTNQSGTLHLDAQGAQTAVFDLAADDMRRNLQLDNLAAGTTVLINVHGASIDFTNHGYTNFAAGQVLFNLPEATRVTLDGGSFGSLLAPLAAITTGWGVINGQVIAQSWDGSMQVNSAAFAGTLPVLAPVPEPESHAMLLAGLGLVGAIARRRRAAAA